MEQKKNNIKDKKVSKRELKQKKVNIEKIAEVIENKKKMPKYESEKINNKVLENILFAIAIMLYLYFIILGSINISTEAFLTDLKVFSILILLIAIILFENSFKNSNMNLCIHGIEILILAIVTLSSIYIYSIFVERFKFIIASVSFIFAIYYILKSIFKYIKLRKNYHKNENDIKDIINKEKYDD